nr:MAG TPA: hypothetical protein [Caudoviricetes sp.]
MWSMRDTLADLALSVYILLKGDYVMMAMLYASKICMEAKNPKTGAAWTFNDVPAKLKKQVAEVLIDTCGLPELVSSEYGGTLV